MLSLPLLFALAVEPLAEAIRQFRNIVSFKKGLFEDKLALYVDDALLFLGDSNESHSSLMSLTTTFGSFSGFTINWDKSVLLPLNTQVDLPAGAQKKKIVSRVKYLGVWVHPDVRDYLKYNLQPLSDKLKSKSKAWC